MGSGSSGAGAGAVCAVLITRCTYVVGYAVSFFG